MNKNFQNLISSWIDHNLHYEIICNPHSLNLPSMPPDDEVRFLLYGDFLYPYDMNHLI